MVTPGVPVSSVARAYPWIPDRGDGTYLNPLIHADYSDPDVIRVGDDFWMTSSSFTCTPGLPILHSKDLVNWRLVNHALRQVPHPSYEKVRPGCGVWAPAIRHHAGKFWIFFPMPDEGIYVTSADHPGGEWSEPWCLQEAKGWIDPCPFWDDDGQAYLLHAYANSRAGKKERIHIRPMSPDCTRLLGEGREVIHTPHHPYLEGPKMHKMGGRYLLMAPGGGVQNGWQVAFRSSSIWGPYEEKIVLETGVTAVNGPHQGALVDLPNGEWWFLHFQDCGPFGRIVHLQPVSWEDGWPKIGLDHDGNGIGEPVAVHRKPDLPPGPVVIPASSDDFSSKKLGLQWQWQANHRPEWVSPAARPGWLRLFAQEDDGDDIGRCPHFLGQKFPARSFAVETVLDLSGLTGDGVAGLAVVGGGGSAFIGLEQKAGARVFRMTADTRPLRTVDWGEPVVSLRMEVFPHALCRFSYAAGAGAWNPVLETYVTREGGWMGARVGLFCSRRKDSAPGGYADFGPFRFS
ncbi:MAG: glycoside hydrolase 43 family protein [Candidatus Methylacidiphilales bacterium]|nr:glycoside hydrolase 43 family protein [Candidatus Methylacidiphilales bacterium]